MNVQKPTKEQPKTKELNTIQRITRDV